MSFLGIGLTTIWCHLLAQFRGRTDHDHRTKFLTRPAPNMFRKRRMLPPRAKSTRDSGGGSKMRHRHHRRSLSPLTTLMSLMLPNATARSVIRIHTTYIIHITYCFGLLSKLYSLKLSFRSHNFLLISHYLLCLPVRVWERFLCTVHCAIICIMYTSQQHIFCARKNLNF